MLRFPGEYGSTYAWAALLDNAGPDIAHNVDLIATVKGPGGVELKEHVVVAAIPPGRFAWGSKASPLFGPDRERVVPTAVDLQAIPGQGTGAVPDDRLLSPGQFAFTSWPQSLTIQPATDPRQLFAILSYYDDKGGFLFASVGVLDQAKLVVGQPSVVPVRGIDKTELPEMSQVKVMLTRLPEIPVEQPLRAEPGATTAFRQPR